MGFFDKSFDPIREAQKAEATCAQSVVAAVADKAGEIADGVKRGVENARAKEPDEYELAVIDYSQTYTDLESGGIELYQSRLRSIDLLDLVTDLVNSIANAPKSFVEGIEEVSHKKRSFRESEAFAREELDSARKSAASAGAGVAAGMAVANIAPSAAMWVAATFGTASTGAAISTLSGAAATNAAMAWLGGDALDAGGGGIYAPDWAIAFKEGSVRHVFFVAETKGTMDTMELSGVENAEIACAKKLFNEMSTNDVRYHNMATYEDLLEVMGRMS